MKKLFIPLSLSLLMFACSGQNNNEATGEMESQEPIENQVEEEPENQALPMEYVEMITNKGTIVLELDPNAAPVTVANFLAYTDEGFYDGTIYHRVISNFMIQGGGFTPDGERKETKSPIELESENGPPNLTGTIAMARTPAPNSATSQFFINVADNDFLNFRPGNPGYAVFGRVIEGMEVVNEIRQVQTTVKNGMQDWPSDDVIIESVKRRQ